MPSKNVWLILHANNIIKTVATDLDEKKEFGNSG
jgi:hypothetical protein